MIEGAPSRSLIWPSKGGAIIVRLGSSQTACSLMLKPPLPGRALYGISHRRLSKLAAVIRVLRWLVSISSWYGLPPLAARREKTS